MLFTMPPYRMQGCVHYVYNRSTKPSRNIMLTDSRHCHCHGHCRKERTIMAVLGYNGSTLCLKAVSISALFLLVAMAFNGGFEIQRFFQTPPHMTSSREATYIPDNISLISRGSLDASERDDGITSWGANPDEWEPRDIPPHLLNTSHDDSDLLKYLRKECILPPSNTPIHLLHPEKTYYSQAGQSKLVNSLLKNKRNGFFIECGAGDGEGLSNSLFFEKSRNWTGLLIEANPTIFKSLRMKKRHAYLLNACVSPTGGVSMLKFTQGKLMGGLTNFMETSHKKRIFRKKKVSGFVEVPCFPIGSLLHSIDVSHVDYFSLDVEGPELDILRSFPFNEVTVDVFTVEYAVNGCGGCTRSKLKRIREFFKQLGDYREVKTIRGLDVVFLRSSLQP